MRKPFAAVVLLGLALAAAPVFAAGDPVQFLVIQPGAPGSSNEAAPLMARLADYLSRHAAGKPIVKALYVNTPTAAERAIATLQPQLAIVTLPYYLEERERHGLRAQLITRPGGHTEDYYRLLVPVKTHMTSWKELRGAVWGTLCFNADAVARLLFQQSADALPFRCEPTDRLLRAVRQVTKGEAAGVLLTDEQFDALSALPERKSLTSLAQTTPLPPPLVVSFDGPSGAVAALTKALLDMKADPAAHDLLNELRTDGFGPIDSTLAAQLDALAKATAP